MQFTESCEALSDTDLEKIETDLHIRFPDPVKQCYLRSNGGEPMPYVFTNDDIDTVVSQLLPLKSANGGTAVESYRRLVLDLKLVSPLMFPFAVDGGGDYFFVDCSSPNGMVSFYRSDTSKHDPLIELNLDFEEFWESLQPE